jgi:hypothetical protein
MEENQGLRRSTRILGKIEQQLQEEAKHNKQEKESEDKSSHVESDDGEIESQTNVRNTPERLPTDAGTNQVAELRIMVNDTIVGVNQAMKDMREDMRKDIDNRMDRFEEALLNLQRDFDVKLANLQSKANRSVTCQNIFDICSAADSITNMTTSRFDTNNKISNIATFTGTTASTILPTIPSVDDNNMTSIISSANNNNSELSVFDEEDFISNSSDEVCVSSKAIAAAASIYTSPYLGIISSSDLPTFHLQNILFTSSVYDVDDMFLVVEKYVFIGRVPFYFANQYVILVWDPGIFYSL